MKNHSPLRVESAKRKAQDPFTKSDLRDARLRQEQEKSKAADVTKTARLRALRLARDALGQEEKGQAHFPSGKAPGSEAQD
jgi:hypothetical protein